MDVNEPTKRKIFWAYGLNFFVPERLNVRDFFEYY